jgi:hypothetical protein
MKRRTKHWVAGFSLFGFAAAVSAGCGSSNDGGSGQNNSASDEVGGGGSAGQGTNAPGGSAGAIGTMGVAAEGGVGGVAAYPPCALPGCIDSDNVFCQPQGFPFIESAFAVAATCAGPSCQPPNPSLTLPEPGKLCLASADPPGGFVGLNLMLGGNVPFDAEALGITQFAFTLDGVPPGLTGGVAERVPCDCSFLPACLGGKFSLPFTTPGKHVVALTDLVWTAGPIMESALNTKSLSGLGFDVIPSEPYDFCVSDFEFLDAEGNVVTP